MLIVGFIGLSNAAEARVVNIYPCLFVFSNYFSDFCGKYSILSDVEVIPADYVNVAYDRTVASDVKYRFVIDASTF